MGKTIKTKKTLMGTMVSTMFLVLQMLLSFWRTKIIITLCGIDVNSVIQTANQLYAYLSLLESGMCAAYQYKMYKPYVNGDMDQLYWLYEKLNKQMQQIGSKMLLIVVCVSALFPFIVAENKLTCAKVFFMFLVVGVRCVLPYLFIVAKKNILIIEEKQYVVSSIDSLVYISINIVEIIIIKLLVWPIEIALVCGTLVLVVGYLFYKKKVSTFWGEIILNEKRNDTIEAINDAHKMTKDIIVHQVCGLVNNNIDVLLLSLFNMFAVTVYSNYNSIINYPVSIINGGIKNIKATIGLKFASKEENTYDVFREILSMNIWIAGVVSAVFNVMINDFIRIWLGNEYVLTTLCVNMFSLILLRRLIAETIYSVRDANGLYKESKYYTLFTAIVNLVISILTVKEFGISGLLFGTLISSYFIMDLGNYRLVFCKVFNKKMSIYIYLFIAIVNIAMTPFLGEIIGYTWAISSWMEFLAKAIVMSIVSLLSMSIMLLITDKYFVKFIKRIIVMICR